jgi:hydrogenase maturation protease
MNDLRSNLHRILRGRVCLVGLGSVEHGDDGLGVQLAHDLSVALAHLRPGPAATAPSVLLGGTQPEFQLRRLPKDLDSVVFLDAVDFGGAPGSVVLLDSAAMRARYPQISTHRLSVGLLAQLVETGSRSRAWLLGVQPESLREGAPLSEKVRVTLRLLCALLTEWAAPPRLEESIA